MQSCATRLSQLRKLLLSRQAGNIACRFTPVSHRAAGLPSFTFVEAAVCLQKLLKSCAAVTVCVQLLLCSRSCATSFQGSLLTSRNIGENHLTCCLPKLLYSASTAAGAQCKSHSQLHSPSQGALILHEEPQFAVKTDASWCTPVNLQNKSGAYYCTAGLSKAGQMLLIIMHMYLCMCIAQLHSLPGAITMQAQQAASISSLPAACNVCIGLS